ncbi:hypothetical protein K458DRAFT_20782 [Lentithecium fluviatile CBS 122367]|uniref:Uncharacterized protein n=1 Tax=Lentithecium fluviatile CBS 122367 TaxID=1168545 RepID=A0A6G1J4I4_9PLEO|nr:hypothetical protein K458DRAFT_20782 [Lentithecium fluviatile CBS 122367]
MNTSFYSFVISLILFTAICWVYTYTIRTYLSPALSYISSFARRVTWSLVTSTARLHPSSSYWSFLISLFPPEPTPPPVTITGIRIPANGTPPHLLQLTTRTVPEDARDTFLFHIPDLRKYWGTEHAHQQRDLDRLELQTPDQLQRTRSRLPSLPHPWTECALLQRLRVPTHRGVLPKHDASCAGVYYVFYSFDCDDLPRNEYVPKWLSDGAGHIYLGDVFVVKMAPNEYARRSDGGWAAYGNIAPGFLEILGKGPSRGETECHSCGNAQYAHDRVRRPLAGADVDSGYM